MPFLALAAAVLLFGTADSMVNSYIVLFGADVVRMTPLQIGVWSSAFAVGGITISWTLGRLFDRRPTRAYAIVVILMGSAGYLVLPRVSSYPLLLLMAATIFGAVSAAFPQLFALARAVLGEGPAGQRATPLLRASWSMAWAVGPLIGAVILSRNGYTGLMWTAAAVYLVAALTVLAVTRPGPVTAEASTAGPTPVLLTVSVTLFFTAMFAGGIALSLFVTRGLNQPSASVGVLFSVCAAVEVVATLILAALPSRTSQRALILGGFGSFAAYHFLTVGASGMPMLIAGQVLRGLGIAVVAAAGIRYFQDVLAPATGRATTLFANSATTGLLISGILSGAAVEQFGHRTTLVLCGLTVVVGAVAFVAGSHSPPTRHATETPVDDTFRTAAEPPIADHPA
ncbi:MFS transporter [Actinoplanes subglobosus]|uniref:MFS transporter n=1 Tax=Actinoplanes subglobosus TaxID=1547892 RepID=A0ABV8J4Y1_9ACTN